MKSEHLCLTRKIQWGVIELERVRVNTGGLSDKYNKRYNTEHWRTILANNNLCVREYKHKGFRSQEDPTIIHEFTDTTIIDSEIIWSLTNYTANIDNVTLVFHIPTL